MAKGEADACFGPGGTSTLRYDPQGKSDAAMLLTVPVELPADLDLDVMLGATESPA
jgi:hypothetical protein